MKRTVPALMILLTSAAPSFVSADDMAVMQLAMSLGDLLASEEPCNLTYDQTAIQAYIDTNVPADATSFASQLNMMTMGANANISTMSGSALTAQCRATERTARHYGFIK